MSGAEPTFKQRVKPLEPLFGVIVAVWFLRLVLAAAAPPASAHRHGGLATGQQTQSASVAASRVDRRRQGRQPATGDAGLTDE